MSLTLGFALLSAIAILNAAPAETETIFKRTFKILHQEPQPQEPASLNRTVNFLTIEQKVDNFNETDGRTWQMRYIANDEFYVKGSPFFIFVGGEWEISPGSVTGGHFYDLAKEHNGYLFYTEHRYYGKSLPTSHMDNKNIHYLSVRQALADLAHFIKEQRVKIPGASKSKVILAGGSYSATMVTWFKKLYPQLTTGAWASSAPLFAEFDFSQYKVVAGQSIRLLGGDECYNRIENGFAALENLFATNRGAEVKALFNVCKAFDEHNDLDVWTFFLELSDIFAGVVQTHDDGDIQRVCNQIMQGSTDINGLSSYLLTQLNENSCNPFDYKTILDTLKDSKFSDDTMRQWTYQSCNEFGWFQTSTSRNQPFGKNFPEDYFIKMCEDTFGKKFSYGFMKAQINATNQLFGGFKPNVENVYFTHGQLDPWRSLGIEDGPQATVVPLYAHCKDLQSISNDDSTELRASKLRIAELVRTWLSDNNSTVSVASDAENRSLN